MNYINDVINNRCEIEDIDAYISDWHESDQELREYEYLGITENEYFDFIRDPDAIYAIVSKYVKRKEFIERYRNDPVLFVENVLGLRLMDYQKVLIKTYFKINQRRSYF